MGQDYSLSSNPVAPILLDAVELIAVLYAIPFSLGNLHANLPRDSKTGFELPQTLALQCQPSEVNTAAYDRRRMRITSLTDREGCRVASTYQPHLLAITRVPRATNPVGPVLWECTLHLQEVADRRKRRVIFIRISTSGTETWKNSAIDSIVSPDFSISRNVKYGTKAAAAE